MDSFRGLHHEEITENNSFGDCNVYAYTFGTFT
jgi:hypothetical protein